LILGLVAYLFDVVQYFTTFDVEVAGKGETLMGTPQADF